MVLLRDGGGILAPPVESPFPADGYWLLAAAESSESSGVEVTTNAEFFRAEPGLDRRTLDYDRVGLAEPWQAALDWAKGKSGGRPYYVLRKGSKASEGPLPDGLDAQLSTLTEAIAGVR